MEMPVRRLKLWPRIAAAASVILALSVGGYILVHKSPKNVYTVNHVNSIKPGHNQATLTLADGRKIILTKNLDGRLATQGNMMISASKGDGITYSSSGNGSNVPAGYNTMSTGKGEQSPFPLVLADGSRVMLNAMSSVTYPTSFNGTNRTVKITGEAYFEVKHDPGHPFRIIAGDRTIEDIGTRFDVNAYQDEPVFKTTLVEGAVRVGYRDGNVLLKPGQQARIASGTEGITVQEVDADSEIAWMSGKFRAEGEKLDEIMRQAARWYDVDVVYQNGALRNQVFGIISDRYASVSELLHSLELTRKVKFKVSGRKITVLNP